MFLIDTDKPNRKEIQILLYFLRDCFGEGSRERTIKTNFVSFCFRFVGGNNNIIQKKWEKNIKNILKNPTLIIITTYIFYVEIWFFFLQNAINVELFYLKIILTYVPIDNFYPCF